MIVFPPQSGDCPMQPCSRLPRRIPGANRMTTLMAGFPPAPQDQVSLANWRTAPFNRWAFQHVRELVPSADIAHDPAAIRALPTATMDAGGLRIPRAGAPAVTLEAFLRDAG